MDPLTDGILLALLVTATVAAAHEATRKQASSEDSCKVILRKGVSIRCATAQPRRSRVADVPI